MNNTINNKLFLIVGITLFLGPFFISGKDDFDFRDFRAPNNGVYVIAHRGAHQGIPENSIPAYQKAIDLDCDFVEIDVRTTKDGQFVSVHNSTIDNYVEGKTGSVRSMTLAELKTLDIGNRLGEKWKNTQIPTFEEILQICQGKIGIYLDLKDAPVPELMELIRKYNMEKDIVWYIPSAYLLEMENVQEAFGASFIMPDPHSEENIDNVLQKLKPAVIATDMGTLSGSFVEKAHSKNTKVFVDEDKGTDAEWEQILDWKTDGIQTDFPERLISYLKNRK